MIRAWLVPALACLLAAVPAANVERAAGRPEAGERVERFDRDPGWDGVNNRAKTPEARTIRQDFGYSPTSHFGQEAGEMGGFINPAAEPAYYAKRLPAKTLADPLSASGKIVCAGPPFHVLLGFFHAGTLNEWRTPNTLALRLQGRGDHFFAYVEYATRRWRAGGDSPQGFVVRDPGAERARMRPFPGGATVHTWSLRYDPQANDGNGAITATVDGVTAVCHIAPEHRPDGATFNRFGLLNVMKQWDDGGEVWLDDVTVNGETERFAKDPRWEARGNRRVYVSTNVRPRFDFGYSPTRFAGGRARGELGGLVFRGDGRYADRMACYGDRLEPLDLETPLRASGKIALRRGVSDSTTLLGFYHSRHSMEIYDGQESGLPKDFLGLAVEGPSSEGFLVYPTYRLHHESENGSRNGAPPILPDGTTHDWTLAYDPDAADGAGRITVTLDGRAVSVDLGAGHRASGAHFDRFGFVTTRIDGNGQHIYFDDLRYTASPGRESGRAR